MHWHNLSSNRKKKTFATVQSCVAVKLCMIVVTCLHTLITGMTVMVILGFYDFLELFFCQSGVITWHTSLMALKSKKWEQKSEMILDFLQSRQGWKYTVKSIHTHPLIFDLMSLRKLHLNQMFLIDMNKFLAQFSFHSLNTLLGRMVEYS